MTTITYCLPLLEQQLPTERYLTRVERVLRSIAKQSVPFWRCHLVVRSDLVQAVATLVAKLVSESRAESSSLQTKLKSLAAFGDSVSQDEHSPQVADLGSRFVLHSTLNNTISGAAHLVATEIGVLAIDANTQWLVVLRDDTQLAAHATYSYLSTVLQHAEAKLIYGDHDQIDTFGLRQNPFFKPEFSLDLLYSQNYIGPIFAIQTQYLLALHQINIESNQSFALAAILEVVRGVTAVHIDKNSPINYHKYILHVPSVLHHHEAACVTEGYDPSSDPEAMRLVTERSQGNLQLLQDHFGTLMPKPEIDFCFEAPFSLVPPATSYVSGITPVAATSSRTQPSASVTEVKPFVYRSTWSIPVDAPLVSLIIPTRDGYEILKACLDSILAKTTYTNYEILIVNNQSSCPQTLDLFSVMATVYENIRVLDYDAEFNYSAINNFAVEFATGSIVGFVNNDIEVITPDWLTEMVSHALREDIGCVGAMHFYPDDSIQHAGVIVGLDGVAGHAFRFENKSSNEDYFNYLSSIRNPDAVTAATLLIRKELFQRVGGFDAKHLAVAFNDVDLCLKVNALGYRCVWTPYAELYHHESKTRKLTPSAEATKREMYEHAVMKERWGTDTYQTRELLQYKKVVA
jgi:GT2 family glycosyltransferase